MRNKKIKGKGNATYLTRLGIYQVFNDRLNNISDIRPALDTWVGAMVTKEFPEKKNHECNGQEVQDLTRLRKVV